jgi:hypothetical protein
MPRINEHTFELDNQEYLLTWYDKPRITNNGAEQKVKPLLREYITKKKLPIQLVNSNGNDEVTYTLAGKVLEHFSESKSKGKRFVSNDILEKKETPKNKTKSNEISIPAQNIKKQDKLNLSKNFKVVMVCAGRKNNSFFTAYPNENFVNNPENNFEYHPDDIMNNSITSFREYLINNQNDTNLLRAYQLYSRNEYQYLYNKFKKSFYILSAGWGLVNSEFRLPKYDITFSIANKVPLNTRRNKNLISPVYDDFNQLNANDKEDIIFIGGKEYLNLFFKLTQNLDNRKIIFYFGANNLPMPNRNKKSFIFINYPSNNNRGWHYEVARYFCNYIIP